MNRIIEQAGQTSLILQLFSCKLTGTVFEAKFFDVFTVRLSADGWKMTDERFRLGPKAEAEC